MLSASGRIRGRMAWLTIRKPIRQTDNQYIVVTKLDGTIQTLSIGVNNYDDDRIDDRIDDCGDGSPVSVCHGEMVD